MTSPMPDADRPSDPATGRDPREGSERRDWFERRTVELLPELHGAALRFATCEADADDLVAAAVARAWEKLDTLKDERSFRGWLFRILTNEFLRRRRTRKSRGPHEPYDESPEGEPFSLFERLHQPFLLWWGNPEQKFLGRLVREDLEKAVDDLAEPYRLAVVLVDIQGFSYREVAETLDVPIGTVRSRLSRGRATLQESLWKHAVDAGLREPRDRDSDPATRTSRPVDDMTEDEMKDDR